MEQQQKTKRRTDGKAKFYANQRRLGWLVTFGIVALALYFVFFVWLTPIAVKGDSMSPALNDGEVVLLDQLGKYWKKPVRGDMVVFSTSDGVFIKRVVALPGETVDISGGRVYINSRPLDESGYAVGVPGEMPLLTVPDDAVFVLGDNRDKVYDSRLEEVGCIPYQQIESVLRLRIAPLSRFTIFF